MISFTFLFVIAFYNKKERQWLKKYLIEKSPILQYWKNQQFDSACTKIDKIALKVKELLTYERIHFFMHFLSITEKKILFTFLSQLSSTEKKNFFSNLFWPTILLYIKKKQICFYKHALNMFWISWSDMTTYNWNTIVRNKPFSLAARDRIS